MKTFINIAALMWLTSFGATAMADLHGIHVNGMGEVSIVPDVAYISFSVTDRDMDANKAKAAVDEATGRLLAVAKRLGVAERLVTAAMMQLNPIYGRSDGRGVQVIEAMQASRTIEIQLNDLSVIGDLVNAAIAQGINGIQNIRLDTSKRSALERQALDLAITDARQEALHVAKQFGVELGALLNVHVSSHSGNPVYADGATALRSAASMPFNPGELTVRRDVQVTFAHQ